MTTNPNDRTVGQTDGTESTSKKDAAKNEAGALKNEAAGAGQDVKDTAKEQAVAVKDEATDQAKDLLNQLKGDISVGQIANDLGQQAQGPAASTVRSLSDEIDALSRGEKPETEYVTGALSKVNQQLQSLASALENKQPNELLDEVRRFAGRRPGAFLAAALSVGLLAGRATRSAKDSDEIGTDRDGAKEYFGLSGQQSGGAQGTPGAQAGAAVPTAVEYDESYEPRLTETETSGYTPGDPYAYRSDEQGEAARTHTDRVPGTVYPEQEGDRR